MLENFTDQSVTIKVIFRQLISYNGGQIPIHLIHRYKISCGSEGKYESRHPQ